MTLSETARSFYDACETGKGWDGCKEYCADNATFSAQADALAEITSVEAYAEWMKGLLVPVPDGHYEVKSFQVDEAAGIALVYALFKGTHSVDGPVPATGKSIVADYVYAMEFTDGKVSHVTKIWNDVHSLKQLGWA